MNLYQKIQAVMASVRYLQKDDNVGFGSNSYKAISEEKVSETIRAAFIEYGLVMFPVEQVHTCRDFDTVTKNGAGVSRLSTVDVKYKLVDIDTGEHEFIVSSGMGVDSQDKAVGKAMTYSLKYAFLRTFIIPTGDDPDKVSSQDMPPQISAQKPTQPTKQPEPPKTPEPPKDSAKEQPVVSSDQIKRLYTICKEHGKNQDDLKAFMTEKFGFDSSKKLTKPQYDQTCHWAEGK